MLGIIIVLNVLINFKTNIIIETFRYEFLYELNTLNQSKRRYPRK